MMDVTSSASSTVRVECKMSAASVSKAEMTTLVLSDRRYRGDVVAEEIAVVDPTSNSAIVDVPMTIISDGWRHKYDDDSRHHKESDKLFIG